MCSLFLLFPFLCLEQFDLFHSTFDLFLFLFFLVFIFGGNYMFQPIACLFLAFFEWFIEFLQIFLFS